MSEVLLEITAIKVKQRPTWLTDDDDFLKEYDFFIFNLPSDKLLRISKFLSRKDSSAGIQRMHKDERDREIGRFIMSEHPFFPNNIIINIPFEFENTYYNEKTKTLKCAVEEGTAYVVDGQHRLKAFASKHSGDTVLDLVVSAYFGLEPPTIAEIFTRINYYQKPVSKSLVYDLLDLNTDREFRRYKEAHEIVSDLNEKISSPFYGLVKMLGVGDGLISQAAFVEGLTSKYRIIELLNKNYFEDQKLIIIESYFAAIKASFPDRWGNPDSILTRSVGFNALLKILKDIILSKNFTSVETYDFKRYTDIMSKINVDSEDIKSYGGFKGVNALAEKFSSSLAKKGLL